jgi:gamma-glutamylcyclotransferase (GGCT)/AIG2-like uncharacterized protein YtfP
VKREAGWSTAQQAIVDRLFVYGTLRSGQAARSLVANYVAGADPASVTGRIYSLSDGYPALVPGPDGRVVGELIRLRELIAAFALLDAYEGAEFIRTMMEVAREDGQRVWAWVYLLVDPSVVDEAELIACGDWARHLAGE